MVVCRMSVHCMFIVLYMYMFACRVSFVSIFYFFSINNYTEGGMLPTSGPPGSGGIPGLPPGVPLIPQRVWSEHDNPEGRVYYYNKVTRQSVWDKPKDLELIMPLPADLAGPQMTMPTLLDNSHQRNVHVSDGINQVCTCTGKTISC